MRPSCPRRVAPTDSGATRAPSWVGSSSLVPWAVAALLGGLLATAMGRHATADAGLAPAHPRSDSPSTPKRRRAREFVPQFAVSPDGRHVVIVGASNGVTRLRLRISVPDSTSAKATSPDPTERGDGAAIDG